MCSDTPPPSSCEAFPKRRGPDASLHCTLSCHSLRGCKAVPLVLGSISRRLQRAAGSPAQQGLSRHQFQKLFFPRSHCCVRRDASPLPLRDQVPKGQKHMVKKILVTPTNLQPRGCLCGCLGVCLIAPDGFNGQDRGSSCPSCLPRTSAGSRRHSGELDEWAGCPLHNFLKAQPCNRIKPT